MAKRTSKMTDDELLTLCQNEIRQSVGYMGGELSDQRRKAMEYYYGEPFGNEVTGRSQYVSRDVADTIEWIMPSIMRIFAGGDQIVRFEPHGPEDEPVAAQVTDYINYILSRQTNGFYCLYSMFKDALLQKNGFLKVYWEEDYASQKETYEGLTDDELIAIVERGGEEANIVAHTDNGDGTHDITIKKRKNESGICIEPCPPEEFIVNSQAMYPLEKNRFVAHRRKITLSELREMGYEDVDDISSDDDGDWNPERQARFDNDDDGLREDAQDESQREVWISECYVLVDYDGDGISERRKVLVAGNRVLANEEVDGLCFITLTPTIVPHKLFGMSVYDVMSDLQLLKSIIFRSILDNAYLTNNNRWMALDGMVNIDDLLTNRPGGVIRVKTFDAVKPLPTNLLGAPMFNLLEYVDSIKENRTGVTRYNQGVDANSLNKTATGISQIMSASQQRIEMIARIFAETGVKDLAMKVMELVLKHQKQPQMVRLSNKWTQVDPRLWANKYDVTVMVGLGTGSREMQMAGVQQIINLQMAMLQGGLPTVTPQNIYHAAIELTKANSMKGGEMFFTSPDQMPPQQQQPDPAMMQAQMQAQQEEKRMMIEAQQKDRELKAKTGVEVFKIKTEAALKAGELQAKRESEARSLALQEQGQVVDFNLRARETGLKESQASREAQREDEAHASEQANAAVELDVNKALSTLAETVVASQEALTQSQQALAQVMQGQEKVADALVEAAKAIGAPRKLVKGPDGTKMSVPVTGGA